MVAFGGDIPARGGLCHWGAESVAEPQAQSRDLWMWLHLQTGSHGAEFSLRGDLRQLW